MLINRFLMFKFLGKVWGDSQGRQRHNRRHEIVKNLTMTNDEHPKFAFTRSN